MTGLRRLVQRVVGWIADGGDRELPPMYYWLALVLLLILVHVDLAGLIGRQVSHHMLPF